METENSSNMLSSSHRRLPQLSRANLSNQAYESEDEKLDLSQPFALLQRRSGVIAGVAIALSVVLAPMAYWYGGRKPPVYAGSFQLLVEPVTAEEKLNRLILNPEQGSQGLETAPTGLDYNTQIQVLRSPKLLLPVVQKLQSQYPKLTYDDLASGLQIARVTPKTAKKGEGTKLLEVAYQSSNPEFAEAALKQLSETYLRYSLQERQSNISQGVKFIDTQLPKLRQRVNTLQRQLQNFRERYTIIDPDAQGQQSVTQSGNLQQQQIDTETKLAETRSRFSALQRNSAQANAVSVLAQASEYQLLLGKYQEIASQIALESARSREENPTLQALRERQRNLQALLQQEAQRVLGDTADAIEVLEARNQAIVSAKSQAEQKIRQYPDLARQYTDLQRELKIATNSLNEFQTKREGLQIDAAQKEVPWELLSPPTLLKDASTGEPRNVSTSSEWSYAALAIFLSVILGVGVGLLIDLTSNAFHNPKEVKQTTRLPLLGLIPLEGESTASRFSWVKKLPLMKRGRRRKKAVTAINPLPELTAISSELNGSASSLPLASSFFVEAFRSLYKNIRLLQPDAPVRSLTISSPEPGDGKSTIAVNLAQAAAAMGQRVLLVDADLRHPQVHHLVGLPNDRGLSDIIASNANVRTVIQQSPLRDNLMVLTAGQTVVNPVELLSSGKMRLLMERFQMVFDLVIYDTPPLVGLADGSLVAAQTDGVVLIIRLGKTKRPHLINALEELKLASISALGLVANGVKETATPYAYHYQSNSQPRSNADPVEVEL